MTIVWIAAYFTEEHRSTLDWLNKITDDRYRFFGLEVELWRIGNSPAAPKFNIVSKPNDWSHSVAKAARAIDEAGLSDTRIMQRNYWAALNSVLDAAAGPVSGNRKPLPQGCVSFPIGRSHFHLNAVMIRPESKIRAELHIGSERSKSFFGLLMRNRDAIERDLGYSLEWEEFPGQQGCHISTYHSEVDPEDDADWPRQHEWLATRLNDLHRVFAQRVPALDADLSQ